MISSSKPDEEIQMYLASKQHPPFLEHKHNLSCHQKTSWVSCLYNPRPIHPTSLRLSAYDITLCNAPKPGYDRCVSHPPSCRYIHIGPYPSFDYTQSFHNYPDSVPMRDTMLKG